MCNESEDIAVIKIQLRVAVYIDFSRIHELKHFFNCPCSVFDGLIKVDICLAGSNGAVIYIHIHEERVY